MKLSSIQRIGGVSLNLGSVLVFAYSACFFLFLPFNSVRNNYAAVVLNGSWVWITMLAFISLPCLMFGFAAVYSRMYRETGWIGLIGYIFVQIAYLLQASKVTWEVFLYPLIAHNQSSIFLFNDKVIKHDHNVVALDITGSVVIFLGILLFCVAIFKSKKFPASSAMLIFVGSLIYGLGPLLSVYFPLAGIIIFSIGCFQIGIRLMKPVGADDGLKAQA